jgi:hypothetical protein
LATDYDAPRKNDDDTESLEAIKESEGTSASSDVDADDHADSFSIPEVTREEQDVVVVPKQEDEFTCSECFIVKHHSQKAKKNGEYGPVCVDCAH